MRNKSGPPSGGNRRGSGSGGARRPGSRPGAAGGKPAFGAGQASYKRPMPPRPARQNANAGIAFDIVERTPDNAANEAETTGPFRVLIAVHRPRFRGRAERAAALEGWQVTSLLNKQDAVGQVQKGPRPPDLLILSGDFGRQKDYGIFRAVQRFREQGMTLIGLVDDCEDVPETAPDSVPSRLCDVCLEPPYKTPDLRALFAGLYQAKRGEPAPQPRSNAKLDADDEEDE